MNLSQWLLESKRNEQQEISLHLFEKCNMSCVFCWQDHDSMVGLNAIPNKGELVNQFVTKSAHTHFSVNLMGGELFDPDIYNDALRQQYVDLCRTMHSHAASLGKRLFINVVSNLVVPFPEQISGLIDQLRSEGVNIGLTTSYDSKGRFNRNQFEVFKHNVEVLRTYIDGIGIVLTKPSIKQMIAAEDPYLIYLYNSGFPLYFDFYQPGEDHLTMTPSDKDLLKAFYYLIDHFPKSNPIRQWIENHENKTSCRSTHVIHPDGRVGSCGTFVTAPTSSIVTFFKSPVSNTSNRDMEDSMLTKWNCVECEYFKRCTLGCFLLHDFMKRSNMKECPFKLSFDKITKGVEIDVDQVEQAFP